LRDASISQVFVAQRLQTSHYLNYVSLRDYDVDVNYRLGSQSRDGSAADMLDRCREPGKCWRE
jgi:hypothetical protein